MDRDQAEAQLAFAEEAAPHLVSEDAKEWEDRLAERHDELSAALHSYMETGDAERTVRLAAALPRYWFDRAHHTEARGLLDEVVALPGADREPQYALVEVFRGRFHFHTGQPDADAVFDEALAACRRAGDRANEVEAVVGRSRVALREHRFDDVRRHANEALAIARDLGDSCRERVPVHMLAAAARMTGDYEQARKLYGRSIALSEECGTLANVPSEHHNLGYVALHSGDVDEAEKLWRQALAETRESRVGMLFPYLILDFSVLAAARGDLVKAATLVGAAEARFEELGIALDPDDASEHEALVRRLDKELDAKSRAEAISTGRSLSLDDALLVGTGEK